MMSSTVRPNYRKLAFQLAAGAVVGAISGSVIATVFEPLLLEGTGAGAFALAGVGLLYAAMGLFVGLGLVFPGLGAKMLNVADRDDLADQRAILTGSAVSSIVFGLALIMVAFSGPQGMISGGLAISALAFGIVLMTAVTIAQWRLYDELMRGLSLQGSGYMAAILFPVLTLWAALAHNGAAPPIDPLGLIALLAGALLAGAFIAVGRRGLLLPA
jgi:hypothetical protein